jgi:hypothetical protein
VLTMRDGHLADPDSQAQAQAQPQAQEALGQ